MVWTRQSHRDADGNEITAFQNIRPTFGGHILPLAGNTYSFVEAGDRNYQHVLIVVPQISDEVMQYITKIQYYILRRGYLISMEFVGKTPKEFHIKFNFLADCASKEAIVNDLSGIDQEKKVKVNN